jgi:formate dehydrogenase subunit gamma
MTTSELDAIIAEHVGRKGALLPMLRAVQERFGCIDRAAEAAIAKALNLSRAEVHGVMSFYHDFTPAPDPRPVVELCRAEACKARGVEALVPAAEAAAGERVNLKDVFCLGLCSVGPNAKVGPYLYSGLDEATLVKLVKTA